MACHTSYAIGPAPQQDRSPSLSRTGQWVNRHMVSSPATERLQDLLDPILRRQIGQLGLLVLGNQEDRLYGCTVVLLCPCPAVAMYNSIKRLSPPTPVPHGPNQPGPFLTPNRVAVTRLPLQAGLFRGVSYLLRRRVPRRSQMEGRPGPPPRSAEGLLFNDRITYPGHLGLTGG